MVIYAAKRIAREALACGFTQVPQSWGIHPPLPTPLAALVGAAAEVPTRRGGMTPLPLLPNRIQGLFTSLNQSHTASCPSMCELGGVEGARNQNTSKSGQTTW